MIHGGWEEILEYGLGLTVARRYALCQGKVYLTLIFELFILYLDCFLLEVDMPGVQSSQPTKHELVLQASARTQWSESGFQRLGPGVWT